MSQDSKAHAESGIPGAVRMMGHKYSKPVARWLVTRPWFVRLVRSFGGVGREELGAAVRVATGFLNLPIGGTLGALTNSFIDDVVGEVAEILETKPELLEQGNRLKVTKDQAEAQAREEASKETLFVAEDIAHAKEDCYLLLSHKAALTQPAKTFEKGGSVKTVPGRCDARVMAVPLSEVLRIGKVLCPLCFENGVEVRQGSGENAPKTETVLTLPERVRKMRDEEREPRFRQMLETFEQMLPQLSPKLREKFSRLAATDDPEPKLKLVLERRVEHWEAMLDTLLGVDPAAKTVEGLVERATGMAGRFAKRVGDRLDSEGGELERVVGIVGDGIKRSNETQNEKHEAYKADPPGKWTRRLGWASVVAFATGWSIYGLLSL